MDQEIYCKLLSLWGYCFGLSDVPILFIKSKNRSIIFLFSSLDTDLSRLLRVVDSLTVTFFRPPFYDYSIPSTCIWTRVVNGPVGMRIVNNSGPTRRYDWILNRTIITVSKTRILLDVNKTKRYFISP